MQYDNSVLTLDELIQMNKLKTQFERKALEIFEQYFILKYQQDYTKTSYLKNYSCNFEKELFNVHIVTYVGDLDVHDDFSFPLEYLFIDNWKEKIQIYLQDEKLAPIQFND